MTIRQLLLGSMMALALSGCSVSFMGTPSSSSPAYNYGYASGGKPLASADYGRTDGKPLHRGSAPSADEPEAPPTRPQADDPTPPAQRKKPAAHRTKPTDPGDPRPDADDPPTRPGTKDKPSSGSGSIHKPTTRRPTDPGTKDKPSSGSGSIHKPTTRRPTDPGTKDKPSSGSGTIDKPTTRRPSVRPSTKFVPPQRKPTLEPSILASRLKPQSTR